jgi:hypothetical protein
MAHDGQRLIREIADVVATATDLHYRRATGEPIAWHEHVQLQRRVVLVLCAIAERSPQSPDVRHELDRAERRMQHLTASEPIPTPSGTGQASEATP